MYLTFSVNTL